MIRFYSTRLMSESKSYKRCL